MTQEELDAMEISFKYHGFTWNQTNFAVAVIRSHVEPLRQQLAEANTLINKYREETTSLRQQLAEFKHGQDTYQQLFNDQKAENIRMRQQVTQLRDALTKERDLRVFGQSVECGKTHWESIRDMRRDVYQKTDEALATTKEQ